MGREPLRRIMPHTLDVKVGVLVPFRTSTLTRYRETHSPIRKCPCGKCKLFHSGTLAKPASSRAMLSWNGRFTVSVAKCEVAFVCFSHSNESRGELKFVPVLVYVTVSCLIVLANTRGRTRYVRNIHLPAARRGKSVFC
jgi:hypothetical protein